MSGFGFSTSVQGMRIQSEAMQVIGTNIANATTGGYRRTDIHFKTMLSDSVASLGTQSSSASGASSTGGARSMNYMRIAQAGGISVTNNPLDAAIAGRGFFTLNSAADGSGIEAYGRDGSFSIGSSGSGSISINEGYITDKNGYFLQGWAADETGAFPSSGSGLTSMRVDPEAFSSDGIATSSALATLNLPATASTGSQENYGAYVVDSESTTRQISMQFVKSDDNGLWNFDIAGEPGDLVTVSPPADLTLATGIDQSATFSLATNSMTVQTAGIPAANYFANVQPGDVVEIADTVSNNGTYEVASKSPDGSTVTFSAATPLASDETNNTLTTVTGTGVLGEPMAFDAFGAYAGVPTYSVAITHANGATSNFDLDLSKATQFGSNMLVSGFEHDGRTPGSLTDVSFDKGGYVLGRFDNGDQRPLYRTALADFANVDRLDAISGNLFTETTESGAASYAGAGIQGMGLFAPNALELSNVNLEDEMAHMIKTQTAYNSSATTFKTMDEMSQTARDLKR